MKYVKKLEIVEAVKYEMGMEDGFSCIELARFCVSRNSCGHYHQCGECSVDIPKKPYFEHGGNMIHFDESDYIVTHSNGHRQCVPAEVFESMYVEFPELTRDTRISIAHVLCVILLLTALVWVLGWVVAMWMITPI